MIKAKFDVWKEELKLILSFRCGHEAHKIADFYVNFIQRTLARSLAHGPLLCTTEHTKTDGHLHLCSVV
jgi:hypothetical protein